jgi:hypothetical protein
LIVVIAGLDPAIHSARATPFRRLCGMDARIKSGHDDRIWARLFVGAHPHPKFARIALTRDASNFDLPARGR